MDPLLKALPAILRATSNSAEVTQTAVIVGWNHAVGDGLRHNAVAVSFSDRKLIVAVADHVWKKQLQSMLGQLIGRLNSVLGQRLVTSIELRVAPEQIVKAEPERPRREPLDVPAELLTAAGRIEDPELRNAFLGAAQSCLKRREEATN